MEALRTPFQKDLLARQPFPSRGGVFDRAGTEFLVIDVDGTREAARQRALPPHRRFDLVCAPGYQGRKRGEVVRTRTVVLQAHTHQFLGTFGAPYNGDYRGDLRRAIQVITNYAVTLGLLPTAVLLRLDGLYGDAAPLLDELTAGLGVLARSRAYHLLDLEIVQQALARARDLVLSYPVRPGVCSNLAQWIWNLRCVVARRRLQEERYPASDLRLCDLAEPEEMPLLRQLLPKQAQRDAMPFER